MVDMEGTQAALIGFTGSGGGGGLCKSQLLFQCVGVQVDKGDYKEM